MSSSIKKSSRWPSGEAQLRSRASMPSAQSSTNESSNISADASTPVQPGHSANPAHATAATTADRNVTWFGVIGVPRSRYTTTAAGGRATHSVNQLMSCFFFEER